MPQQTLAELIRSIPNDARTRLVQNRQPGTTIGQAELARLAFDRQCRQAHSERVNLRHLAAERGAEYVKHAEQWYADTYVNTAAASLAPFTCPTCQVGYIDRVLHLAFNRTCHLIAQHDSIAERAAFRHPTGASVPEGAEHAQAAFRRALPCALPQPPYAD